VRRMVLLRMREFLVRILMGDAWVEWQDRQPKGRRLLQALAEDD
jgi:hypothetical protein